MTARLALAASALALALAACAGAPPVERPPVAAPRVATSVRHARGSPLAGGADATGPAVTPEPASSLQVVVSFVALDAIPENLLEPLSAHARLVTSTSGDRALLATARLLSGARAGIVPDAEAFVARLENRANHFADLRGALPRGVTATFEAACDRACGPRGESVREELALHVSRRAAGAGIELALEIGGSPAPGETLVDELAALDVRPLALGEGFAVIVPSPFEGDDARALAAVATIAPPPAPGGPGASAHRVACALCAADLARDAVLARENAAPVSSLTPPRPDLGEACRALALEGQRRHALFALAQATGAPLAEDLALTADDRTLGPVCAAVAREVALPGAPASGPELGWIVERAALSGVRDLVGEGTVSPEVEEELVRRAGAVGRSLGTFFGIAESARSLDDLEQRLRLENRDLLEDSSPAVRARAFDWLRARGLAPAGYEPLGPAEERRAALDRASEESQRGHP